MPLLSLDHVNVRTTNLERLLAFYEGVLGLSAGPRPPFSFEGAWLYVGERPVVHLVVVREAPAPSQGTSLDHFAFRAENILAFVGRLREAGVAYQVSVLTGYGDKQVGFADPDGNRIHVDFPASEELPETAT